MTSTDIEIKKLAPDAPIPYNLLLLADETVEAIDKYLPHSDIYIATMPNRQIPIAVMAMQPNTPKEIEIMNIAVNTVLQSRGIGSILLDKAMEIAQTGGYSSLKVGTADCGMRQINFYQRNGFKVCDIRKDYFLDKFPEPIYENGVMLKDMVVLERKVN
ncbi:N-acetyltransferase [Bacteroides sp. 51]|uniref:GNAT family N-acetyltransferase n=1 Tax=Bacteroides sp. 51 TaxID=2302938 RepID=UPI0013D54E40|nr:GNAT family N-acetyltransferase [Bacteroides sp. 51]NDV80612.1 GNAT family N-acetyltransferase [Bacteroides sp. 51]